MYPSSNTLKKTTRNHNAPVIILLYELLGLSQRLRFAAGRREDSDDEKWLNSSPVLTWRGCCKKSNRKCCSAVCGWVQFPRESKTSSTWSVEYRATPEGPEGLGDRAMAQGGGGFLESQEVYDDRPKLSSSLSDCRRMKPVSGLHDHEEPLQRLPTPTADSSMPIAPPPPKIPRVIDSEGEERSLSSVYLQVENDARLVTMRNMWNTFNFAVVAILRHRDDGRASRCPHVRRVRHVRGARRYRFTRME